MMDITAAAPATTNMSPDYHETPQHQSQTGGASSSASLAEMLDIPFLDDYLHTLLLPHVDGMLQYFPWKVPDAAIKIALLQLATLWMSQGQTPATRALKLELAVSSPSSSAHLPTQRQPMVSFNQRLMMYGIISIGLPRLYHYLRQRWRQQQQRQQSSLMIPESSTSTQHRLARDRRVQTVETMFRMIDSAVPMIRLSLLLSCWSLYSRNKNKTATATTTLAPTVAMWWMGWQYTTSNSGSSHGGGRQPLHVLHAHRRWLQEEGMRLVPMVITPFWNTCYESRNYVLGWCRSTWHPWRRQMIRMKNLYRPSTTSVNNTPNTSCPVCSKAPIGIPYEANCGHVYCYSCLWHEQQQHKEQSPSCRVCHALISSCRPCD